MQKQLLLYFLLFSLFGVSQTVESEIERCVSAKPREIKRYEGLARVGYLLLKTGFNDAVYLDVKSLNSLENKTIIKVDLIYTTFRKNENFDQHSLNKKRLKALFEAAPNLISQGGIELNLIAQTGCTSAEMGKEFFHGVAITYRDNPTEISKEVEKQFLLDVASGKVPAHAYNAYIARETLLYSTDSLTGKASKKPLDSKPEWVFGETERIKYFTKNLKMNGDISSPTSVQVKFFIDSTGKIDGLMIGTSPASPTFDIIKKFLESMPLWKPGVIDGKPADFLVSTTIDFMGRGTVAVRDLKMVDAKNATKNLLSEVFDYSKSNASPSSRTVPSAFEKNKWTSATLICDVTASMAMYNAQMIAILEQKFVAKDTSFLLILFFNDGDDKKEKDKKIGAAGGIYTVKSQDADGLTEELIRVMEKGTGGLIPENNLEAILEAEKKCPKAMQHVMIADNQATPRDISLVSKVTKPVHFIVCGDSQILNPCYLDLARLTKGSVYFNGQTIQNIDTFEEGATVACGRATFELKKGKFVLRPQK